MATQSMYDLHDHAGVRWLAPFLAVLSLMILGLILMLVYPHITG
jgi:hypothetical protein